MPSNQFETMSMDALGKNIVTVNNINQINKSMIGNIVDVSPEGSIYIPLKIYPPSGITRLQWNMGFNKDYYVNRRR